MPQGEEVVVLPPLLHLHLPTRHLLSSSCSPSPSCFMQRGQLLVDALCDFVKKQKHEKLAKTELFVIPEQKFF